MIETIALAFGLAMDATAMAAVRGLAGRREALVLPLLFGAFQAGMAAIGWVVGAWGGKYIDAWDHWLAFGLLTGIGIKMLIDAWRGEDEDDPDASAKTGGLVVLLGLALATSIDAAAAGITLPLLPVSPWLALVLIGVVTYVCSLAGFALGRTAGPWLGRSVTVLGAVILIAIGVRILVQHVSGSAEPAQTPAQHAPIMDAGSGSGSPGSLFGSVTLPKGPGTPPVQTSAPLDPAAFARLAKLEVPAFTSTVRSQDHQLDVRHTTTQPKLAATVMIAPCFDCLPMELAPWKAKEVGLQLVVPSELRDRPDTVWELGQTELHGQPLIFTYHRGRIPEGPFSHAYVLYYADGTNQIRVIAEDLGDPASVTREQLAQVAKAFLDVYTHAW